MTPARPARILLPGLFFLAWALLFTYPLLLHMAQAVVLSGGGDAYLHLWDLWWADKALVDLHQNSYHTNYLLYPTGLNLYYHSLDILNGVLSIPLQHLFGLTTAFNLLLIANLTLDGWVAYWLCAERTGSVGAGLVGGALFASAPLLGTSVNLGQLDEVTVWWIPLYVLALLRALDSPGPVWSRGGGRRASAIAGLCLVGASLATWYFTAGLAVFTAVFVPCYLLARRDQGNRASRSDWLNAASKVAVAAAITVIVLSPLLWSMIAERLRGEIYMLSTLEATLQNSADVAGLVLPARTEVAAINIHGSNVALGLVALGLSLLGLVKSWTRAWPLGAALLVLVVLALGPHLQVLGKDTGFPLPYALLDRVPFIGASRQPLRFLATAGICLSLLAAYGTVWLLAAAEGRSWQRALVPALLVLVALELFGVPRALLNTDVDPAYAFIRDQPEDGAVMELPYERWQAPAMLNQSIHERPILGGYTSRHFPYQFVEGAPGVAQLAVGFPPTLAESDIISPSLELTALPSLDYYGVRYAVMHKADIASGRYGRLQTLLRNLYPDGPAYEDDEVLVYRTPVGPGNSGGPTDALPLVGLGSGWHELEENPTRRWAGSNPDDGNADIWLGVRPTAEGRHTLSMDLFSYGRPRTLTVQVNGKDVGTAQVDLAPRTFEFDLGDLREGNYNIRLLVDEPPESPPGDRRKLSIGSTRVEVRRDQP